METLMEKSTKDRLEWNISELFWIVKKARFLEIFYDSIKFSTIFSKMTI